MFVLSRDNEQGRGTPEEAAGTKEALEEGALEEGALEEVLAMREDNEQGRRTRDARRCRRNGAKKRRGAAAQALLIISPPVEREALAVGEAWSYAL